MSCARCVGLGDLALDAQLVVAGQLDVPVLLHQLDDAPAASIGGLGRKRHAHQLGPGVDLLHAVGLGQHAQAVRVEQRLALRRQLAEAVGDLLQQRVDLLGLLGRGQPLVQVQPRVHVAAVGVGQQRRGVQVDLGGGAEAGSAGRARARPSASARPRPACRCRAGSRPPSCCRSGSRPAPRRRRGSPGRASRGRSREPSSSICWIASRRCAACLVRPCTSGTSR